MRKYLLAVRFDSLVVGCSECLVQQKIAVLAGFAEVETAVVAGAVVVAEVVVVGWTNFLPSV